MDKDRWVFDIEANGLLRDVTKIHCLVALNTKTKEWLKTTDYSEMVEFLTRDNIILIGHNIVQYDIPTLEKILNITITAQLIDTLGISWYLNSSTSRKLHGLEQYGVEFGVPKPVVEDWQGLTDEEEVILSEKLGGWGNIQLKKEEYDKIYLHRCSEDVKINFNLWLLQQKQLVEIYGKDIDNLWEMIEFISFKLDCLREQEEVGINLDIIQVLKGIEELGTIMDAKYAELQEVMPRVPQISTKKKPKNMFKKDGSPSAANLKWKVSLQEAGFTEEEDGVEDVEEVDVITGFELGNPNSHIQIKDWLFSLGWVPINIKHVRNKKTGDTKKIPQIKSADDDSEICDSIKKLFSKVPELEALDSYSKVNHRLSILTGFVRDSYYGRLYGGAQGFTNTMRLKHRVLVNLPGAKTQFGEYIRSCLVADDGDYILYSADVSALEDSTKMHFIFPYDPEYVKSLSDPRYDAHTAISVKAGMMTKEEGEFYIWYDNKKAEDLPISDEYKSMSEDDQKEKFLNLKDIRHNGKQANFASTYGVGKQTLAVQTGLKLKAAENLLESYWELNWSIKKFAESLTVKTTSLGLWILNPINNLWYSLRSEKDRFSCVNQAAGDWVFNKWLKNCRESGLRPALQMHDEHNGNIKRGDEEKTEHIIDEAMNKVNDELKLNVTIRNSIDFSHRYIDCH